MLGRGGLLRSNPAYRRYFLARITSVAGGSVAPIALAFAVLELGDGATGISVVLAVEYIAYMAMMPLMGVLADRSRNLRALLICSQLLAAAFQFTEAGLIFSRTAQVWSLSVVAAGGAAGAAMSGLAGNRLLAQILAPAQLSQANALFRTAQMSVAAAGPAAGGALVAVVGPGWGIVWDAVTFLAAAAWFARLPHTALPTPAGASPSKGGFTEGWKAFTRRRWLLTLVCSEAIAGAAFMSVFILGPLYAVQNLNGARDWGVISGCLAAGSALGALLAGRLRLERVGLIVPLSAAAFAAGPAAMGLDLALPYVLGAVLLGGILAGPGSIARRTVTQIKIPNHQLGRVDGHTELIGSIPIPITYALAGRAADHLGAQLIIGICAATMAAAALAPLALADVRRLRLLGKGATAETAKRGGSGPPPPTGRSRRRVRVGRG
jgi:MFS family permease